MLYLTREEFRTAPTTLGFKPAMVRQWRHRRAISPAAKSRLVNFEVQPGYRLRPAQPSFFRCALRFESLPKRYRLLQVTWSHQRLHCAFTVSRRVPFLGTRYRRQCFVVARAGSYGYFCGLHPQVLCRIIVTPQGVRNYQFRVNLEPL